MNRKHEILGYEITSDPEFLNSIGSVDPELARLLPMYKELAMEGRKSSINILLKAIEKFPQSPQLKIYLLELYTILGETEKADEINYKIFDEHPDCVFGTINMAIMFFYKEEYEKIPELLGEEMDLSLLFPQHDIFHITEVTALLSLTVLYFSAIHDFEQAEKRFNILSEIAPNSQETEMSFIFLDNARTAALSDKMLDEIEAAQDTSDTYFETPVFFHEEIKQIYRQGLYIDEEILESILLLPRDSVIRDLELVLTDSIDRYEYFKTSSEHAFWDEDTMSFVLHAIFLLGELESLESISVVFKVICQSDDYHDLFLGDFLQEALWEPIYKMGNTQLHVLKQFLIDADADPFNKAIISQTVEEIAHQQIDRKEEVIQWFQEIFQLFLERNAEEDKIDDELVALIINSAINIEAKELLPQIKQLYDRGLISEIIWPDFQEIESSITNSEEYHLEREILPIAERYEEITLTWASYTREYDDDETWEDELEEDFLEEDELAEDDLEEDDSDQDFDYLHANSKPITAEKTPGRNDPCPCGSGKKYKKCCMNK